MMIKKSWVAGLACACWLTAAAAGSIWLSDDAWAQEANTQKSSPSITVANSEYLLAQSNSDLSAAKGVFDRWVSLCLSGDAAGAWNLLNRGTQDEIVSAIIEELRKDPANNQITVEVLKGIMQDGSNEVNLGIMKIVYDQLSDSGKVALEGCRPTVKDGNIVIVCGESTLRMVQEDGQWKLDMRDF